MSVCVENSLFVLHIDLCTKVFSYLPTHLYFAFPHTLSPCLCHSKEEINYGIKYKQQNAFYVNQKIIDYFLAFLFVFLLIYQTVPQLKKKKKKLFHECQVIS